MNEIMQNKSVVRLVSLLLIILSVYFVVMSINEIKTSKFIGGGVAPSNTMSFDGKGEVKASPDIANVSFTVEADSALVKDAQTNVTEKMAKALAMISSNGILKSDIKTENYSSYPKYSNSIPCYGGLGMPCRNEPTVIGYTVSQNVTVKIRNLDNVGKVLQGLGDLNVTNISGPNFAIDNEDSLKIEARTKAISDAEAKATELAKELGVNLVRIVNFSENGNGVMPMYAKSMMAGATADIAQAPTPDVPAGQNTITSNVTITYEIR